MKRFILGLVMLVGLVLTVGEASAAKLAAREIGWAKNTATTANPVYYPKFAIGAWADTTMAFSLIGVSCPTTSMQVSSGTDSVTVAWVRFFQDTTAAVTPNLSVVNYKFQTSGDGITWKDDAQGEMSYNGIVAGDTQFGFPIWFNAGEGYGAAGTRTSSLLTAPYLRVVFKATGVTGSMSAVRCQLLHWAE